MPTFGSVSFILTLCPKWGCDNIPHAEKTLECPSPPIYPQWDVQPSYIAIVQDNKMHKIHVPLESGRSLA